MAVNTVSIRGNLGSAQTDRGPSRGVWSDCPVEELLSDPSRGVYFFDDFLATNNVAAAAEANYGIYKGFASTGASVAEGDEVNGVKVLTNASTDNTGASLATVSKPFQLSRDTKKFWFETRIKTSTIADTKHGIFVGLIDTSTLSATVPIAADGTLADENFVGFHRLEGDGDAIDTVYKADGVTQVTVGTDAVALVADTYVKLGMVYEPQTDLHSDDRYVLTFYKDGIRLADVKQIPSADGTDFPNDVRLGLVIAVLTATATTPGTTSIDWWRAAQLVY